MHGRKRLDRERERETRRDTQINTQTHRLGLLCLPSFDILPDDLGADRSDFPASCYVVCGTQSGGKKKEDKVMLLKMTNLTKTLKEKKKKEKSGEDDESESESEDESSDEEEEEDPVMKSAMINQTGRSFQLMVYRMILYPNGQ